MTHLQMLAELRPPSWVEQIRMISTGCDDSNTLSTIEEFNVVSWNILAEQYLTPRSHPNLPKEYADVVFHKDTRRKLLLDTLERFCSPNSFSNDTLHHKWDVIALQELDLHHPSDDIIPSLESWGYTVVKTSSDQRKDCCAIVFDKSRFKLIQMEVVHFDDLATMRVWRESENNDDKEQDASKRKITYNAITPKKSNPASSELTGLVRSFLRRNCALIVHLHSIQSNQSFIATSAHLYWHPGYEYVKTCQAKYLLDRVHTMATITTPSANSNDDRIPTIICGDINSKPGSIVHQLFLRPYVDARKVAPWRYFWDNENEEMYTEEDEKQFSNKNSTGDRKDGQDEIIVAEISDFMTCCTLISSDMTTDSGEMQENINTNYKELKKALASRRLGNHVSPQDYQRLTSAILVKYICDYTLNKFCRWLRILGIDATLETEAEEKERTTGGKIALFEHCQKEQRTLLTTSYKLLLRKDCPPGAYLLDPKSTSSLEKGLPRLLLTHGVKLVPCQFLTRCVVCNGKIVPVLDDNEKRLVFKKNGAPPDLLDSKEDMEVFRCDGCRQGYWWDDRPSSSASRVFAQATKLFRLCLRGGVEVDMPNLIDEKARKEIMGAFDFVDLHLEKGSTIESELTVIHWLRDDKLRNPFHLRSAYAARDHVNVGAIQQSHGEAIHFTNVTSDFVGVLDYIFFESSKFQQIAHLYVPTSFKAMNRNEMAGGHLLPSNAWPSDHLAVGVRLAFGGEEKNTKSFAKDNSQNLVSHPLRCRCGCVPNVLSLFEMAELRKKARETASKPAAVSK